MAQLLGSCAKGSRGQWWNTIAARAYGSSTCGQEYFRLFSAYFDARINNPTGPRRIDNMIGTNIPSFVSTSAMAGDEVVASMTKAADAGSYDAIDQLHLGQQNFATLYFGPDAYQDLITAGKSMFSDALTQSIVSMGSVSWAQGMHASAQEPATNRAGLYTKNGHRYLATGGFVDQIQSKLGRMIGCQKTVAINTTSPVTDFSDRYSPKIWDQYPKLSTDLYSMDNPQSAEAIAFAQTDALLCARWSAYTVLETWQMADDAYHELMLTTDSGLLQQGAALTATNPVIVTQSGLPKSCYGMPLQRNNKFPPYSP